MNVSQLYLLNRVGDQGSRDISGVFEPSSKPSRAAVAAEEAIHQWF